LIFLGNSGVGKSFLANRCLGNEKFQHKCKPTAVTTQTDYSEISYDDRQYRVFDVPGLVEAKQDAIERNKKEIYKAFDICPNSMVLFVFGTQGGRIRNEDVIAFNALNDAYPFESKSLAIVVNSIPNDHDEDYEGETIVLLKQLLNMQDACRNICFLENIDKKDTNAIEQLRQKLFEVILQIQPKVHAKVHDIELNTTLVNNLLKRMEILQEEFRQERQNLTREIQEAQHRYQRELAHQQQQFQQEARNYQDKICHLADKLAKVQQVPACSIL